MGSDTNVVVENSNVEYSFLVLVYAYDGDHDPLPDVSPFVNGSGSVNINI